MLMFHLFCFLLYAFTIGYDLLYINVKHPERPHYGGRLKFFTFWNALAQCFYFGLSTYIDIFHKDESKKSGNRRNKWLDMRDTFFASIAFPTAFAVAIPFWGIYAIDRELIYPKYLDAIIPSWFNHNYHTCIVVFMVLEAVMVRHIYPTAKQGLARMYTYLCAYQIWILWIAYYKDYWVYPFMKVMDVYGRFGFFTACWLASGAIYFLGYKVNNYIWGKENTRTATKKIS